LQVILDARRLTLDVVLSDADDMIVGVHPASLSLALHNLLENSIRYSPAGGTITIGALSHQGACQLYVCDEGPGIAEAERERVFDRFYRPANDGTNGTGLGLSIVRAIASAAGGRAWVEPRQRSQGLKAVIELPLLSPELTAPPLPPAGAFSKAR
jgi:signal transduction histidine kinase